MKKGGWTSASLFLFLRNEESERVAQGDLQHASLTLCGRHLAEIAQQTERRRRSVERRVIQTVEGVRLESERLLFGKRHLEGLGNAHIQVKELRAVEHVSISNRPGERECIDVVCTDGMPRIEIRTAAANTQVLQLAHQSRATTRVCYVAVRDGRHVVDRVRIGVVEIKLQSIGSALPQTDK